MLLDVESRRASYPADQVNKRHNYPAQETKAARTKTVQRMQASLLGDGTQYILEHSSQLSSRTGRQITEQLAGQ